MALAIFAFTALARRQPDPVTDVIAAYTQALGGLPAIDAITSRKIKASVKLLGKTELYWQKPDKVLLLSGKDRTGFDGSRGWIYTKRKRVHRMPQGAQISLEIDGNPLRYAHLRGLYSELSSAPGKTVDDTMMDILVAPNDLAQTIFYFDAKTHLLARIDEKGDTSAYYTQTIWFEDYRAVEGVLFPFHIIHKSTGPGLPSDDFRVKSVENNVPIDPENFSKPQSTKLVFGGKR